MDRASRLTEVVRTYDRALYVVKSGEMLQLWRREYPVDKNGIPTSSRPEEHFILALTHDWTLKGKPVDWGIEPLMNRIKDMDAWRDDTYYEKIMEDRELQSKLKKRRFKNNLKALAYDSRRDIAKASDDIRFGGC